MGGTPSSTRPLGSEETRRDVRESAVESTRAIPSPMRNDEDRATIQIPIEAPMPSEAGAARSRYVYDAVHSSSSAQINSTPHRVPRAASPTGLHHEHSKRRDFPLLDNLAVNLVSCFANATFSEIKAFTSDDDHEQSQGFKSRADLLRTHRRVYASDSTFIEQDVIRECTPLQREMIRRINRASFVLAVFESTARASLMDLNEHFLETFMSPGQKMLLWHGAILLEIKTQAFIFVLMSGGHSSFSISGLLDDLFPVDLDAQIISRHPETPLLAPSELDFIERARARKQYLQAEGPDTAITVLPAKYAWNDFVKDFAMSISRNADSILSVSTSPALARISDSQLRLGHERATSRSQGAKSTSAEGSAESLPHPVRSRGRSLADSETEASGSDGSFLDNASRAKQGRSGPMPASGGYFRQSWSSDEEQALLAGLTRVGGPFWSQILSLYGRGGSLSEVLKDRNQVQLKDKARNLKLWYLKTGGNDPEKVPECLRHVTGELRKRGGIKIRAAYSASNDNDAQPAPQPSSLSPRYSAASSQLAPHLPSQEDASTFPSRPASPQDRISIKRGENQKGATQTGLPNFLEPLPFSSLTGFSHAPPHTSPPPNTMVPKRTESVKRPTSSQQRSPSPHRGKRRRIVTE